MTDPQKVASIETMTPAKEEGQDVEWSLETDQPSDNSPTTCQVTFYKDTI